MILTGRLSAKLGVLRMALSAAAAVTAVTAVSHCHRTGRARG